MARRHWFVCSVLLFPTCALAQERGELFSRLDANNDGYVSEDEVQEPQKGLFERLIRNSDKDGDKRLSREEFQAGFRAANQGPRPGGEARGNDGSPERGRFGGPANPEFFGTLFDRTDVNKDGKLTKDEIPEERQGMRMILERAGGDALTKEQFVRGMLATVPTGDRPQRPEGRPEENRPREGEGQVRRPGGPPRMPPPGGGLFAALDNDRDGQLSNQEIVGAGLALLKLDRNSDGRITPDEAFGPPGDGGAGGRGPGDRGPREIGPGDGRVGDRPEGGRPPFGRPEGGPGPGRGNMGPEALRDRLKASDTNGDGKVSKEEAPAFFRDRIFDQADANSDGSLDESEIQQVVERSGRARGGPGRGGPGRDGPGRGGPDRGSDQLRSDSGDK